MFANVTTSERLCLLITLFGAIEYNVPTGLAPLAIALDFSINEFLDLFLTMSSFIGFISLLVS
jgi:hypothetical protein